MTIEGIFIDLNQRVDSGIHDIGSDNVWCDALLETFSQKGKAMAHTVSHSPYRQLTDRLNRFPQGAPPAALLTKILKVLFDPREAELVSLLPVKPFTVKRAAAVWHMPESEAHKILDQLAGKALLVDFEVNGDMNYVLPPPMAGFSSFP